MNDKKDFQKTVSQIMDSVTQINPIQGEDEIKTPFVDEFTTDQQRTRDKNITELLKLYVEAYCYKNKSNKWYKGILFGLCIMIMISFSVILAFVVLQLGNPIIEKTATSMVQLITACITFLTLIVNILKIITKYVFPANEEEYITRIVELIQNNDLENKKENIRVRAKNDSQFREEMTFENA